MNCGRKSKGHNNSGIISLDDKSRKKIRGQKIGEMAFDMYIGDKLLDKGIDIAKGSKYLDELVDKMKYADEFVI